MNAVRKTVATACAVVLGVGMAQAKTCTWTGEGVSLTIGGELCEPGTSGSSESSAEYKDDVHFSGVGIVKTGEIGFSLIVR